MSNLKRFLAMTLVMVMMVSSLAMSASAKFFDDVDALKSPDLTAAIDLLSELGIAKGTGEDTFDPESLVTRQQFALFVARIHSATPEYFVPSDSKDDIPQFADVVDKTYFTAINYCYQNKIINGIKEPVDGAGGEFAPENGIIFQDAVKMLISGLGYASATEDSKGGLAYPVGYLAKAKEIGLLDGFGLDKIKAGEEITRANMAGLLYNYFLSDYIEVQLVWNPVQNQNVANQIKTPVCNKFGITKIEGYVTAIEGASLPMWVEDPYMSTVVGASGSVTDMHWVNIGLNDPISMRNANPANAGHYNIVVSWVTPNTETSTKQVWETYTVGGNTYAQAVTKSTNNRVVGHLRTTKEALGLEKDYKDLAGSRELLGLKVIAFVDSSNKKGVTLPETRVVGTKQRATTSAVDGNVLAEHERDRLLNSFTFNFEDGEKEVFNQYNGYTRQVIDVDNLTGNIGQLRDEEGDINYYTGYVFTSETTAVNNGVGTGMARNVYDSRTFNNAPFGRPVAEDARDIRYLAGVIRSGKADQGAMAIDVIDNGVNRDGTPNRYVIFTPYEAGYLRLHDQGPDLSGINPRPAEGWRRITRADGTWYDVRRQDTVNRFIKADSYEYTDPSNEKAYYFSNQGEHILVGKQLVELTTGNTAATVTDINADSGDAGRRIAGSSITLDIGVANSTFVGSNGRVTINFNHENVYYSTLNNRRAGIGNITTYATNSTFNQYSVELGQQYKVFAIDTVNYNYGFVGADSSTFFIFRTGNTAAVAGPRYGYVVEVGSTININTETARRYEIWNLTTGRMETVNVVAPVLYGNVNAGDLVRYENVGASTHRILGAVDPVTGPISIPRTTASISSKTLNASKALAAFDNADISKAPQNFDDLIKTVRTTFGITYPSQYAIEDLVNSNLASGIVKTAFDNFVDELWDLMAILGSADITYTGNVYALIADAVTDLRVVASMFDASVIIARDALDTARSNFISLPNSLYNYIDVIKEMNNFIASMEAFGLANLSASDRTTAEAAIKAAKQAITDANKKITIATADLNQIKTASQDVEDALAVLTAAVGTKTGEDALALEIAKKLLATGTAWAKTFGVSDLTTATTPTPTPASLLADWIKAYNTAASGLYFRDSQIPASLAATFSGFITDIQDAAMTVDTVNGVGPTVAKDFGLGLEFSTNFVDNTITITTPTATTAPTGPFNSTSVVDERITSATQFFLYEVDGGRYATMANTISLADFTNLMRTIELSNNRSWIESALAVTNLMGNVDTLFIGVSSEAANSLASTLFAKTPATGTGPNYSATYGEYIVTAISGGEFYANDGTPYIRATAREYVNNVATGADVLIAIAKSDITNNYIGLSSKVYLNQSLNDNGTTRWIVESRALNFNLSVDMLDMLRLAGTSSIYRIGGNYQYTGGNLYVSTTNSGTVNLGSGSVTYAAYSYSSGYYTRSLVGTETTSPGTYVYGSTVVAGTNASMYALLQTASSSSSFYLVPNSTGWAIVRIG